MKRFNWKEGFNKKKKNKKVLVMLSGGRDSALCLSLLKKEGIDVTAIHFNHNWTWPLSTEEAKRICKKLDVNIVIEDITKGFYKRVKNFEEGRPCKVCKPLMYIKTIKYALKNNIGWICLGDNANDTIIKRINDYEAKRGNENLTVTKYLDCVSEGIKIPKSIDILRPLVYIKSKEIEKQLNNEGITIRRNCETGDKYYEYWREGCPIQYNDPGHKLTAKRMDELLEYNTHVTDFAKKKRIRASIHLPSKRIVTIPGGHEEEVRKYLISKGLNVPDIKMDSERPYLDHFIIEVFDIPSFLLKNYKSIYPLIKRFIERTETSIVKETHYDFKPFGVTSVFIVSESHLIFHTWPENNYVHIDFLSCKKIKCSSKFKHIVFEIFKSKKFKIRKVRYKK